jgi:hypothetical protein
MVPQMRSSVAPRGNSTYEEQYRLRQSLTASMFSLSPLDGFIIQSLQSLNDWQSS